MSKKLGSGGQLPRQGWKEVEVRVVTLSADTDCPMIDIKVGQSGRHGRWLIDSGARESVVDSETFRGSFAGVSLQPMPGDLVFKSADGSPLAMLGYFSTEFWFGNEPVTAYVFVCKGVTTTRLIGANILKKFPKWGVDNRSRYFYAGDVRVPLVSEAMATSLQFLWRKILSCDP